MNGTYTAVVDRIVDGKTAVLLLEDGDELVAQVDLPVAQLPETARHEGVVLTVEMVAGDVKSVQHKPDETRKRRKAAKERLDRLSTPLNDRSEGELNSTSTEDES